MTKKLSTAGLMTLAAAVALCLSLGSSAEARPKYFEAFKAKYPDFPDAAMHKCSICHPGKEKKERNNYGAAVGKALGAKNVKDADKINAALDTAAGEASAIPGKTFGELIKDGKLPASK